MKNSITGLLEELGSEATFTVRLREIMQERGISQAKLAKELEEVGHPLHQSAISKILNPAKGQSRRSVSIDDALAFSRALKVPLPVLLIPSYAADVSKASGLLIQALELHKSIAKDQALLDDMLNQLCDLGRTNDQARSMIREAIQASEDASLNHGEKGDHVRANFFKKLRKAIDAGETNGE
ncbi:hypothetical protein GCM10027417_30500 [Glutamicibacter endophyticus]